ncbi:putative (di)nucleoside polyphosphate hydrolase [Haloferula luteola]|uniref:Putative (Di)nucleoside polyphosphate hydrolase n=1 Tax=Haloferula luteola TaxID=595692 RepID=A0A840VHR4_9BACT|nr:NUDIX domain-containing protein [Haloferula luteola]MBB5352281.1 putative (di)nucleoside polyphosphate hydrolase [Haloferula luteola]
MKRFRPNVAGLMVRSQGDLLICERWQMPGAWQFPQGGVDDGEALIDGFRREIREEIGLKPETYRILDSKGGYRYLYPPEVREKKLKKHGFDGQEQTYFLCELNPGAPEVDTQQRPREFGRHRWIWPDEFDLDWVPGFKRSVYRQVMMDFFKVKL